MNILKKGFSRNLLIGILSVFLLCVAILIISFYIIIEKNSKLLEAFISRTAQENALLVSTRFVEHIKNFRFSTFEKLESELRKSISFETSILGIIVFGRTSDEGYFRVLSKIVRNPSFRVPFDKSAIVTLESGNQYLQRGLIRPTVDPTIHMDGSFAWRNVYHPYNFQNYTVVLCVMVSSLGNLTALEDYNNSLSAIKKFLVIVYSIATVAVIGILVFFVYNYQLLLRHLAAAMQRAKAGDLSVNISVAGDDELSEIALSFNSLVEELKILKEQKINATDVKLLSVIFKMGVEKLKKGEYEDAVHLFSTFILVRPESFGGIFNLAVANAKLRRYDESLRLFDRALEINPNHELAILYRRKVIELKMRYGEHPSQH